jgi:hypothetical protein
MMEFSTISFKEVVQRIILAGKKLMTKSLPPFNIRS